MRISIIKLMEEAKKRMSGYAALLNYRYHNLCVKARPEALLSFSISDEGVDAPIEDVANVCNAPERDDQFEIYPLSPGLLLLIIKSLKKVHPEFLIEIKTVEGSDDEDDKYILATMPPVDKARHDVLMEAVGILADWCNGKMEATFSYFTASIQQKLMDAQADEIDEAKDALQDIKDAHDDLCKQFRADKEGEIEDAYQQFQAELEEKKAKLQEEEAAHNLQAGLQMKMTPDSE